LGADALHNPCTGEVGVKNAESAIVTN
jgi:hypothetical protein